MNKDKSAQRPGCLVLSFNREPSDASPMMRMVVACGFFARLRGLLGTDSTWGDGNTALMISQCASVHTFGMRYPLDIAFADKHGVVLRADRNVLPGRLLSCKGGAFVLERPCVNASDWFSVGERLRIGSTKPEGVHCND